MFSMAIATACSIASATRAAGPAKVHLDVQFTRYRADDSPIGAFRSLWIVTEAAGRAKLVELARQRA